MYTKGLIFLNGTGVELHQSLLLRAYRGEKTARPPVWFMRQAGRYLPEYRELRKKHSMLEAIRTPELAAEITLQPLKRFEFDGSIIFADILTPLIEMGVELDFVEKEGPKIFNPIRSSADVERLVIPDPTTNAAYTFHAIEIVSRELSNRNIPLLGFCGAPFTLASYLIEGGGSKSLLATKRFMFTEPEAWAKLQQKLVAVLSGYLIEQAKHGAAALQIFDSWLGYLNPGQFERWVVPGLKALITAVKAATDVPIIFFSTDSSTLLPQIKELGADVIGVDWRVPLSAADRLLGSRFPLQGNLDPTALFGSRDYLEKEVRQVIESGRELKSHIFNLGHGILPETPIANVEFVIGLIKSISQ